MEPASRESTLGHVVELGRGLVSDLELERILEGVLEAAVELTDARYAALGVLDRSREGLERFIHRGIDEGTRAEIGDLPTGRGVLGLLISEPEPIRLADVSRHPRSAGFPAHHPEMHTFLGVPITILGSQWGNLYLTEKVGGGEFTDEDERAAVALADWAAIAIGNARSVATERLRFAMDAAEQERMQWARELHDESLQGLAAVRLLLATTLRHVGSDPEECRAGIENAVSQIDTEIASMRALITDLRPEALHELGVVPALEGLARRFEERNEGILVEFDPGQDEDSRLPAPLEVAVYRVTQEAINNAIKHGGAAGIRISLERADGGIVLTVSDNGAGFDPEAARLGFGIVGMRERAELAGGHLEISSNPGSGTTVRLRAPLA